MSQKFLKSRHILELTVQEKQKFLDSFDMVLTDCDGVLWMLVGGIDNAGEAINLIKNEGKTYKFISNNSMRTDEEYLQKLKKIGVDSVNEEDLVYPVKPILKHIKENFTPDQKFFVLGTPTFENTLKENGVNIKTLIPPADIELEDVPALITPTEQVAAVIFDISIRLSFMELALAEQYLKQKNCQLLVGAYDAHLPITNNLTTLGQAGIINLLSKSCHKEPIIFGKPGTLLGQYLLDYFEIDEPKRVLFVGDNLEMDIKFGLNLGFQSLFVLSGAHTMEDLLAKPLDSQPDYYADSMGDFLGFFNDLK